MPTFPTSWLDPETLSIFLGWFFALTMVVHISFAIGVLLSGRTVGTPIVGHFVWALATLLGGPFTATAFWLVHHSALTSPKFGHANERDRQLKLVARFECGACQRSSLVTTQDDRCIHCGELV